jgi:hypothetical protein
MPNWVEHRLAITGNQDSLDKLKELMAKPYTTFSQDWQTNEVSQAQSKGAFQLWNIVSPTDLASYFGFKSDELHAEEMKNRGKSKDEDEDIETVITTIKEALAEPFDVQEMVREFQESLEVGQDWYHWNIREWGTKWEISNASYESSPNRLVYSFCSAWSPPVSALDRLAKMFPDLVFTIRFLDEGDNFAGEIHWESGEQVFDTDLAINHGLKMEMYDECYACNGDNIDDTDYDDLRNDYGCSEWGKLIKIPTTVEGAE